MEIKQEAISEFFSQTLEKKKEIPITTGISSTGQVREVL
jgi:hypothetical protein